MRIQETMTALGTFAGGIVLEKFHLSPAFRAFFLKNGPRFPVLHILPRTFHGSFPLFLGGMNRPYPGCGYPDVPVHPPSN
jgi:hypothetical protein